MKRRLLYAACLSGTVLLGACSSDNDDSTPAPQDAQFSMTVTNLTPNQIMSPIAMIMHSSAYSAFEDGEAASVALEDLAEGGSNAALLQEASANAAHISSASTDGPLAPQTQTAEAVVLSVPQAQLSDVHLTVATMLIRTNDAFSAINARDLSSMQVGQSVTVNTPTWDAGTEANTETTATIPGLGGEGTNLTRDDIIDRVRFHQGVVTNTGTGDGLTSSDLTELDRFDNPTMRVVISRIR